MKNKSCSPINSYIGITLGPISEFASFAEDTKSLWATSFLFSYIGQQIVDRFCKENDCRRIEKMGQFLKPYVCEQMFEKSDGVGYFPDQYILKAEQGDYEKLIAICNDVYDDLAMMFGLKENNKEVIKQLVKINVVEVCVTPNIKEEEAVKECGMSVIEEVDGYLNAIELRPNNLGKDHSLYIKGFLRDLKNSSLVSAAFEKTNGDVPERLFESVLEYSARALFDKKDYKEKKTIITNIEKGDKGTGFRPFHKYIAIVSADGDNVGKTLSILSKTDPEKCRELSEKLVAFQKNASEEIKAHGGASIYQGGDDLFFFAPICNMGKSVFALLEELSRSFEDAMDEFIQEYEQKKIPITLSFGVSIAYYKHPMFETVDTARGLMYVAKGDGDQGRNRMCVEVRKHSGQQMKIVLDRKNKEIYEQSLALIETVLRAKDSLEKEIKYLHSMTHWVALHDPILELILSEEFLLPKSMRESSVEEKKRFARMQLNNYFLNSFDEDVHKSTGFMKYQESLTAYLLCGSSSGKALNQLLRFVELLISERS